MRSKLLSPLPRLAPGPDRNPGTPDELRWCGDAPREPALTLFAGGSGVELTSTAKADLLKQLRGGEHVELELEAITFIQRETPNRNYVRFKAGILAAFAKSFAGQPMLADHNSWELSARGGTIVASKLEHNEDGSKQIRMRLKLVKPWAVEGALDGTLDRFSIGWSRAGVVECSICNESLAKCDHWPGDRVGDKVCEAVFTAAVGTEVSGVNVPAVVGTRIDSISRLEAIDPGSLAYILAEDTTHREPDDMKNLPLLLLALSLPSTASEEDAIAAAQAQADRLKIAEGKLVNVGDRLAVVERETTARLAVDRRALIDSSITQLIAAGKLKPASELEAALRRQGGMTTKADGTIEVDVKRDVDVFSASVKDLLAVGASVTPIGAPLLAAKADPKTPPVTEAKAYLAESPESAKWLATAGITPEQFEKHGANAREIVASRRES